MSQFNFVHFELLFWLCLSAAPLGAFLIFRKMSFVGDALAHATLAGTALVFIFYGQNFWLLSLGALVSGFSALWLSNFLERRVHWNADLCLSLAYSFFLAIGLFIMAKHQMEDRVAESHQHEEPHEEAHHEGEHHEVHSEVEAHQPHPGHDSHGHELEELLMGDLQQVKAEDLWMNRIWAIIVLGLLIFFWRQLWLSVIEPKLARSLGYSVRLIDLLLMAIVSVSVVAMMRSVGVILVSTYLILPAASALPWARSLLQLFLLSVLMALMASLLGFSLLQSGQSLPPGPLLALSAFGILAISLVLRYTFQLRLSWGSLKKK